MTGQASTSNRLDLDAAFAAVFPTCIVTIHGTVALWSASRD
jgi:hypothetical protein